MQAEKGPKAIVSHTCEQVRTAQSHFTVEGCFVHRNRSHRKHQELQLAVRGVRLTAPQDHKRSAVPEVTQATTCNHKCPCLLGIFEGTDLREDGNRPSFIPILIEKKRKTR
jgi:hypothetical protein